MKEGEGRGQEGKGEGGRGGACRNQSNDLKGGTHIVTVGAATRNGEPLWPDKPGVSWCERIGVTAHRTVGRRIFLCLDERAAKHCRSSRTREEKSNGNTLALAKPGRSVEGFLGAPPKPSGGFNVQQRWERGRARRG